MQLLTIRADQRNQWHTVLAQSGTHDFYHSAAYHALAEQAGEGEAVLVAWRGASSSIALPVLLRPIAAVPGLEQAGRGLFDATSVYGYAGPVASQIPLPCAEAALFAKELEVWLHRNRVVSLFSRLHPLLGNEQLIVGLGEAPLIGQTVSIDLSRSDEEQTGGYRSNHRRDIKKLRKGGFSCRVGSDAPAIRAFSQIYRQTMARVDAAPGYIFDEVYFRQLLAIPGLALMLCCFEDQVCAGAILSTCGTIAQYHLGGTADVWLDRAPMKLIFDEARKWALKMECTRLHLGGGLGAREDALFNFKAGFSADRHPFRVWRWIVDQSAYDRLAACANAAPGAAGHFPAYRA